MKIQCDVCNKDEASVFCTADEAALCTACDHRVHHANKLAGKHNRFSLDHPSPKQLPICDICQEKRAFLFCHQDRAILCLECDIQIHKANEHTQKHSRFLLTGVKLSANSAINNEFSAESTSTSLNSNVVISDAVPSFVTQESKNDSISIIAPVSTTSTAQSAIATAGVAAPEVSCGDKSKDQLTGGATLNGQISASSISEYLIDTLPGWGFEDFLDSTSYGLYKNGQDDGLPFWNGDLESNKMSAFPSERMGSWVPHASPLFHQTQNQPLNISFGASNLELDLKEHSKRELITTTNYLMQSSKKRSGDNSFTVPQIFPPNTIAFKRSRTLWQ